MTRWEPSGLVICQCQVMLLQYQCPKRFPLAGLSSTQQSMYGTASDNAVGVINENSAEPFKDRVHEHLLSSV